MGITNESVEAAPEQAAEIVLNEHDQAALYRLTRGMPAQDWTRPALNDAAAKHAIIARKKEPSFARTVLFSVRNQFHEQGYSVVRLGKFGEAYGDEATRRALVILTSQAGKPFGAFHERGFFQTLGVDEDAKEFRAQSAGYIPFHIDFCQASKPPQGVSLYCVRPDPNGGGENLVCDYARVLSSLDKKMIERILATRLSYSRLFNSYNIGVEYNPHPLMDRRLDGETIFRYNGKALPDIDAGTKSLFLDLESHFLSESKSVMLEQGDLILINQRKVLHARQPLHGTRDSRADQTGRERLLWQHYISSP